MVSLVRSLLLNSELVFIDEPLSNIDPSMRKIIIDLIKEYFLKKM